MIGGMVLLAALAVGSLESGFADPPQSAKPHTWYHLMNGNVTKAGITRDFEALAEAGFGGVQMFDAGCEIPPGGVDFNTPAWFDLLEHAAREARRLGLEICIPNCSGWSSSGGPWNPPSNGMKRVVFSEKRLHGPFRFKGKLTREMDDNGFYADIAVLAFPTPAVERVSFSDVRSSVLGPTFTLASEKPFSASGISFQLEHDWLWFGDATLKIEISDDGENFRMLESVEFPLSRSGVVDMSRHYHGFPSPVVARAIRGTVASRSVAATVKDASPEARRMLSHLRAKTFDLRMEVPCDTTPATTAQIVEKASVCDLTSRLAADGTLDWNVPEGEWTVLRIGFVCNGCKNRPASDHGVGLEVDKLSAAAMDYHFEQYVARLCRKLGPLAGNVTSGFNAILVDSYEVGSQNWTQGLEREFSKRRGYDLIPYLPTFAGYLIGDVEESERFLEDFRRVVAGLFAENYAGKLAQKCHEYGLSCFLEPYGNCPADNLQYGRYADIPMGEFWSHASCPYSPSDGNAKFVSSVAHVWGKAICGAEAFTAEPGPRSGRWMTTPFGIKAQGDLAYADGINRLVYHRFTHQPWADDRYLPGMTMGRWGMHLDRTQTWWAYAKPFFRYQARCQYMLQRGRFVADVLFFSGEGAPNQGGNTDGQPQSVSAPFSLPGGYAGDVCSADAIYKLQVHDGEIVSPGGVRYQMLVLPSVDAMTPRMGRAIRRLQREGARILWRRKPVRSLGLSFGNDTDGEMRRIADEILAAGALQSGVSDALKGLGICPQLKVEPAQLPEGVERINWIHRTEEGGEWYFVSMPNRHPAEVDISFRVCGLEPEIWDAESGDIAPARAWCETDGRTVVRVPFDVCGSKFVVFRREAVQSRKAESARRFARGERVGEPILSATVVRGPWQVSFPNGFLPNAIAKGSDEWVDFDELMSWSDSRNPGVRYFSGSATYHKRIVVPEMPKGARLLLELGEVREVAEVTANGCVLEALWHPPYRTDLTDAVADGRLDLSIRVANLWANRLIGDDRQFKPDCEWKGDGRDVGIKMIPEWVKTGNPSPTGRHTFTTWRHWTGDDELLPSGLLGPVRLLVVGRSVDGAEVAK